MDIELMQDFSEVVHYENTEIPFYISTSNLFEYPDRSVQCHWHDDIEWIFILKGTMCYYVNGKHLILKEKDCLMVNARQMHYGYAYKQQNCYFLCILFHPSLFGCNQILVEKYVKPILENKSLEYLYLDSEQKEDAEFQEFLTNIVYLKEQKAEGYELEVIASMYILWSRLLQKKELLIGQSGQKMSGDLKIQRDMVSFLYQHYSEKITLDEIAVSGHVSRSKCCRIFQYYLQQSPIDFLNAYRLKVSCYLLRNTEKSVTEIAFACGFNHLSYFSKIFFERYGCTPRVYRNANKSFET